MKLSLLILLAIFSFSFAFQITKQEIPQAVNWPFAVCGNGTWTMKNLTLTQAPARNTNDAVDAFGIANDYIQFSKVDIVVKLNGLFLHSQSVDYKKQFDSGDIIQFQYNTLIPSFAPAGTYVMSFSYKTRDGKQNGCWSFTFKL